MTLTDLLAEIRRPDGSTTSADLASRLGVPHEDVVAMLATLRAAGMIGAARSRPASGCPSTTSCSMRCPGPERCPLVADPRLERLEFRRG